MNHYSKILTPFEVCQKIEIHELRAEGCHGISQGERALPQRFSVDAQWKIDGQSVVISDDIRETVNYSAVAKEILRFVAGKSFHLLESLAFHLARDLLNSFPEMREIRLKIRKFPASWSSQNTSFSVDFSQQWQRVFLGLGSNLGDKLENLRHAKNAIAALSFCRCLSASAIHRTAPLLYLQQEEFLNQSLCIETLLLPEELLEALQRIEIEMGREKHILKGPRTMDIDLLFYGNFAVQLPNLQIPHPEIHRRRFWIEELGEFGIAVAAENAAVLQQQCVIFSPEMAN